ncbi:MAG TPA: PCRF domain-containing protein, partial [Candidatus Angelobacter sp.]|nr:PCRF domain-containing protein [Candidatus Angelobacter sp.]
MFDAPSLRQQLAEIEKKVGDPNVWADQEKSQVLMRQRRRLEESLVMDADLARRVEDIQAYFDLAREGEAVVEELRKEIDQLREVADKLETQTLMSGEHD